MTNHATSDKVPAVELRKKDGKWLAYFYVRIYENGVTRVQSTKVKWRGTPPESMRDAGDAAFEASRTVAEGVAGTIRAEAATKGRDTQMEARILEHKTGEGRWKDTAISKLPDVLKAITHRRERSPRWESWKASVVADFVTWARYHSKAQTVLGVTMKTASDYIDHLLEPDESGNVRTSKTVRTIKLVLKSIFAEVLPADKVNPFEQVRVETPKDDREVHRKPLSPAEVERLLAASEDDPLIHDLIVTGLSTGLRRGDVCRLKWESVDLRGGVLKVTTSKTGAEVYLPIMPKLREVLEGRLAERKEGAVYVFPHAQLLLEGRRNEADQTKWNVKPRPDYLTERVKRAFALALAKPPEATQSDADAPERVDLAKTLPRVLEAVEAARMPAARRVKMTALLSLYAEGKSYRAIQEERGLSRGTISLFLHEAETLASVRFLPDMPRKGEGIKRTIRETLQGTRTIGRRAASLYDFHCLRTTFVTQAISSGMSIDKLKALTGHTTVELVLRHYFKPKGTDVAGELEAGMAPALTGRNVVKTAAALPAAQPDPVATVAAQLNALTGEQRTQLAAMLENHENSRK